MNEYENKVQENVKRNEKYINEFEKWLINKNLVHKTIKKHINNIDLYLNDYLNYYYIKRMEDGIDEAYKFFSNWFIRKCLWASKNSIKETASSIKKFYKCMSEYNYVSTEDYKSLCVELKEFMDEFLEALEDYDNGSF